MCYNSAINFRLVLCTKSRYSDCIEIGFLTNLEFTFLKSETICTVLLGLVVIKVDDIQGKSKHFFNIPIDTIRWISLNKVFLRTYGTGTHLLCTSSDFFSGQVILEKY